MTPPDFVPRPAGLPDTRRGRPTRLRETYKAAGWKRYDVAALVRREPRTVERWERGDTAIPSGLLYVLCRQFDVSAEHLLGWDGDADDDDFAAAA